MKFIPRDSQVDFTLSTYIYYSSFNVLRSLQGLKYSWYEYKLIYSRATLEPF